MLRNALGTLPKMERNLSEEDVGRRSVGAPKSASRALRAQPTETARFDPEGRIDLAPTFMLLLLCL